jgi:hypothetical protein
VALGATYPQIIIPGLPRLRIDRLRAFTGHLRFGLTDDLLAGRASTIRTEHQPGYVLRPPSCPCPRCFRHSLDFSRWIAHIKKCLAIYERLLPKFRIIVLSLLCPVLLYYI